MITRYDITMARNKVDISGRCILLSGCCTIIVNICYKTLISTSLFSEGEPNELKLICLGALKAYIII